MLQGSKPHLLSFLLASLMLPALAFGADFYVDPQNGSSAGDGSAANPWQTMQQVWDDKLIQTRHWDSLPYQSGATLVVKNAAAPVRAGDTIWLRSGYHGDLLIIGAYNESMITIAAQSGHTPQLRRVNLRAAANWTLRGLSISPSYAAPYGKVRLIDIDNHSWHGPSSDIVVEDCELFSVRNSSPWSADDWVNLAASGIQVDGDRSIIRRNTLLNVSSGINATGDNVRVERNRITNFSNDGMRGLGDYGIFEYNIVENSYKVDGNHDDGFQSWTNGSGGVGTGIVRGVVLRGNMFIGFRDPNQPLRGTMQGIGCFDGFFEDWIIENNIVVVNHWHGITLLGARNSRIINNTVIDVTPGSPGPAWIRIASHKNGQPSSNNVVRNNLATNFTVDSSAAAIDHNITVSDFSAFFVAYDAHNLRLKPGAAAIDAGSSELAPDTDIEGAPRPLGSAVDIGAYEWFDASAPAPPKRLRRAD